MFNKDKIKPPPPASDIILIVLILLIVYGFGAAIWILPDTVMSDKERRALQTLPSVSSEYSGSLAGRIKAGKFFDRVLDSSYGRDMHTYFSDQFPLRSEFVGIRASFELWMQKRENNSVVFGKNGYLAEKLTNIDDAGLWNNFEAFSKFRSACAAANIPFTMAVGPRAIDVMDAHLPPLFPVNYGGGVWKHIYELARECELSPLPLYETLVSAANDGVAVYYKTDHHWTTMGAYEAYREIMLSLSMEPLELNFFTPQAATENFSGTTWSKSGMYKKMPEVIYYYRYPGDEEFVTEIVDDGTIYDGFYDRSYLSGSDAYSSFLSGNHAHVRVYRRGGENRPVMLLVKDSFAHSVSPFLAYHFDLEIIDLRYYRGRTADFLNESKIDYVTILYHLDTLCTELSPRLLLAGLKY